MIRYLIKRLLYMVPILIGVHLLTFILFFMVNSPDDVARSQLGDKRVTQAAIDAWKRQHDMDQPLFYNHEASGIHHLQETLFFKTSHQLLHFDFGQSANNRSIRMEISQRMWPSLALALPTLCIGMMVNLLAAVFLVYFRSYRLGKILNIACMVMMSLSALFYVMGGQYLLARKWHLMPVSGFSYDAMWHYLMLPILIGVMGGLGSGARWYRVLLLEESQRPYIKTARAKGLTELQILYRHVIKNAMLPIITGVVSMIPLLFMGSLIMESFFGIPGLGSYTIDAIMHQDFAVVRAMVYLGTLLFMIGLLLTDVCYTLVDPRIRLSARGRG